jgi:predicted RNA-binding protein (TIGR00451 family)
MQIDKGGIRFIMNGADVMCPGLTSAGGVMCEAGPGDVVVRLPRRGISGATRFFISFAGNFC